MKLDAFEALWQALEPSLVPQWDMTLRVFELTHPRYPTIFVEAGSEALAKEAFRNALLKLLA
jgi:hypothetical protein